MDLQMIVPIEAILQNGFAANAWVLGNDRTIAVDGGFELDGHWALPSRAFRFPIEVHILGPDLCQLGLLHPDLTDHPFVRHVEKVLTISIPAGGAPNECGHSKQSLAQWWHAVDLMYEGRWQELLTTRRFTTADHIANALAFALRSSPNGQQRLTTVSARQILHILGAAAPASRQEMLEACNAPSPCSQEKGQSSWPVNISTKTPAQQAAWALVIGIEEGWFAQSRSGLLNWSEAGRLRHSARGGITYTEANGQIALAI